MQKAIFILLNCRKSTTFRRNKVVHTIQVLTSVSFWEKNDQLNVQLIIERATLHSGITYSFVVY